MVERMMDKDTEATSNTTLWICEPTRRGWQALTRCCSFATRLFPNRNGRVGRVARSETSESRSDLLNIFYFYFYFFLGSQKVKSA